MSCVVVLAASGMDVTVCMTTGVCPLDAGARSRTVPPTLVDADTSESAAPLFLMSRYATVVCPVAAGACTYAPTTTTPAPPAWLREEQPAAAAASMAAAPASANDR